MSDEVLLERQDGVAILTLNRPDKLNALNAALFNSLEQHLLSIKDDRDIRVVVITGSGVKAFAAGADISELHEQDAYGGKLFSERGQRVFNLLERLGKPVVAAINGFALGGGCELAMACHIRFASTSAKFGQPEINLGIIPGYGGTQRLPRLVGRSKALELILSGDIIPATEALRLGLADRLYAPEELVSSTLDFAKQLAAKAPLALTACLEAVQIAGDTSILEGNFLEASLFGKTCGTDDFKEGTQAFLEKRAATFSGT